MRALMSMSVAFKPVDGVGSVHYPTAVQIAEAFTALGLQPPSLEARRRHTDEPEPATSETVVFERLAEVATTVVQEQSHADDELLRPSTVDTGGKRHQTFADVARKHLSSARPDDDVVLSLAAYALPVLMRMPARNAEDREKRRLASESLVYASVITPTRSQFVVSVENRGAVTVRLHNPLIEHLQQGCEDLLRLLKSPIVIQKGTLTIRLQNRIEIYEVGQEDSTITGRLVGFRTRDRVRDLVRNERVGVVVSALLSAAFIALFIVLVVYHGEHATSLSQIQGRPPHASLVTQDQFWLGEGQRLQSGLIPVLLVTLITVALKYPRNMTIRWTLLLRSE
jgi:hypothetical protein